MKLIQRLLVWPVVAALLLAGAFGATPARAASGVVGHGHPGDCTEAAFDTAFGSGDPITFDCGPAPVTIVFHIQKLVVSADVTIEGGNLITLSGGNNTRLFAVVLGLTLTLKNIVLEKGNSGSQAGGAVNSNAGRVVLDHATIQDSHTTNQPGGAIQSAGGAITLTNNSLIQNNNGYNYGAINTTGSLAVDHSIIRYNTATFAGGGLSLGGLTTIDHSQIYSNTANGAGGGGGLYLTAPSLATLTDSQVYSNTALDVDSFGGGIDNFGTLGLVNASLSGNGAGTGGGLSNESGATATLYTVSLNGNSVIGSGYAGGVYNKGTLTLTNATVSANSAPSNSSGGGLGLDGGSTTTVVNSTLAGNRAGAGGGLTNSGALTLLNDTLSGNTATGDGGGLEALVGSVITLTNVTFSGNSAPLGGGIAFDTPDAGDSLTLKNTIVSGSPAGGNCYVFPASVKSIASAGFNLSDDNSCAAYFNQGGEHNNQPARLFALANNGGPTLTHLPQHSSPAIDSGAGIGCPGDDQRGIMRPQGGACDIGAVEVQPTDLTWPSFLPAVRR